MKDKCCLVTGGAGFIGSHLVDRLLHEGFRVRIIDDFSTGKIENINHHKNNSAFTCEEFSILDNSKLLKMMKGVDLVFHLACRGVRHSLFDPVGNAQVNASGALNMLESAKHVGVPRILYCSSSEVYGTAIQEPMNEFHPTFPRTVYGASKLAGEAYARAYWLSFNLPVTVARPFNCYGPRSHHEKDAGELIPRSIVKLLNNEAPIIFGDGNAQRDFTFVTDTVDALYQLALHPASIGETYNIGSGEMHSVESIINLLSELCKKSHILPSRIDSRPGDVNRLICDPNRLRQLCGWIPTITFQEGLKRTVEYFRNHLISINDLSSDIESVNWNTQ